jgi:small GTP-binding protein
MASVDGVRRLARLKAHKSLVGCIDWSSDGKYLASVSDDSGLIVFDMTRSGSRAIESEGYGLTSLAWRPGSQIVAASRSHINLVNADTGQIVETPITATWSELLSWSPDGTQLASVSDDETRVLAVGQDLALDGVSHRAPALSNSSLQWSPGMAYIAGWEPDGLTVRDASSGKPVTILEHTVDLAGWVRWSPNARMLAFSYDQRIFIYDTESWEPHITIEGHESWIPHLIWSSCGRLLASISWDSTVRLWSTESWQQLATLKIAPNEDIIDSNWLGIAFHPSEPVLATLSESASTIDIWQIDIDRLVEADRPNVTKYMTAKVVLVGDSGVGKTGLGYRLATGEFREHSSTHGQHFWVTDDLATVRADGTECEVVLWDFAGQSDYRLIHVLFLDDADTAVVVFDPTRGQHALDAVDFWLNALQVGRTEPCPVVLVAARVDRGTGGLAEAEIRSFAESRNISGDLVVTSASTGEGLDELASSLREQIPWESMSATVTTATFKVIKDHILGVKAAASEDRPVIVTGDELRESLPSDSVTRDVPDSELWAAVHNLAVHGYLGILRTGSGERVILTAPELLNNLAASLVLEARRNPAGLGAVDEDRALLNDYPLAEVAQLPDSYRQLVTEAAIVLLLEHNVCFRETLGGRTLLIFPELINEKPPVLAADEGYTDGVTYVVEGNVQNVYASLVVLLGYTNVLTRVNQWQNRAEYEIDGVRIGFRQSRIRDERLELTVYHHKDISTSELRLFQGLIERFLQRRRISVRAYPRVRCECGFALPTEQVVAFIDEGNGFTFCPRSGHRIDLPTEAEAVSLTDDERAAVTDQSAVAGYRTGLAVAITQLRAYVETRASRISCFVSYAWGDSDHAQWTEQTLVPDLEAAGLDVVFDRRSAVLGDDIARFVGRIEDCDFVLVVGTPSYLDGYENQGSETGRVVAAEVDLYNQRLTGTEQQKRTVIPLLRGGDRENSLPPLLRGKAGADLRSDTEYFHVFFDLALRLWGIAPSDPAVKDIRQALADASPKKDRSAARDKGKVRPA